MSSDDRNGAPLKPEVIESQLMSPIPRLYPIERHQMGFPDAIREILNGKRITRVSWNMPDCYGLFADDFLRIHINGENKVWSVNSGDLEAIDWITLPDGN